MLFKKYLSFFFLFLFLFPTAEKQLHAIEHADETECTATDKHFHSEEHECSICDFTSTDSNASFETNSEFVLSVQQLSFSLFIQSVNTPDAFSDLPSRAPPIV